jgi:hypothetical protein
LKKYLNILSKKRNISNNISNNTSTNYSLSNRLNNFITTYNEISILSKCFIKNIKKINIKNRNIINEKSLEHKKIVPINYFQDYKKRNSSNNKKIRKEFINFSKYIKIKNIKHDSLKIKKNKKDGNNILVSKQKRPFSKEEKTINLIKIKDKSKDKIIKNKRLKIVAKKGNLPGQLLIKRITKSKYSNLINTITRSEIRNGRKNMNNKSKKDISQKLFIYDDKECDIDDILQDKKIPEGEGDNFDDLYSIIKKLNFKNIKENDKIFTIENNEKFSDYKNKFEKIWNKKYI